MLYLYIQFYGYEEKNDRVLSITNGTQWVWSLGKTELQRKYIVLGEDRMYRKKG